MSPLKARKRFGQHFLEPAWVRKVIEAIQPAPDDVFVEIGPGRGALTFQLAQRVRRLVAVEIDRDLASALQREAPSNVQIVTADVLDVDLRSLLPADTWPIRVAGNLPYNISSPILFRLLSFSGFGRHVSDATLMLQREVADRLVARPGTGNYGVLSITAQLHAEVTRPLVLPPGAFRPAPRVNSALVRLAFRIPAVLPIDPPLFVDMVRSMFEQRRKMLGKALGRFAESHNWRASEALAKAGIDARRRPETLDLAELARLAEVFASAERPDVL